MQLHKAEILKAVFARKGGDLAASEALLAQGVDGQVRALLADDEVLILGDRSGASWMVLTEKRLVIAAGGRMESIPLAELDQVSPDLQEAGPSTKADLDSLRITLSSGHIVSARLQSGGNFLGWLNVLMAVVRGNVLLPGNSPAD
ncbi:MAG: hypothetical protein QM755_21900 [Luteolibacter sp.]